MSFGRHLCRPLSPNNGAQWGLLVLIEPPSLNCNRECTWHVKCVESGNGVHPHGVIQGLMRVQQADFRQRLGRHHPFYPTGGSVLRDQISNAADQRSESRFRRRGRSVAIAHFSGDTDGTGTCWMWFPRIPGRYPLTAQPVFPHLTGLPTGAVDSTWTIMVDRDGVVNRRIVGSYVRSVAEFEILPGAVQALVDLSAAAGRVVLVTNQAGLGKRLMTVSDLDLIHRSLLDAVARRGGHIDGVFYCPHLREDNCPCRKPGTGLADQAVRTFPEISLSRTVVIGDSSSDMEFADRLGVPSVFIGSPVRWDGRPGNIVAADLSAAARLLIGCRSNRR